MASSKRCHYEVLGVQRDCTAEEIRSAYKKLALQRHPDKLIKSGITEAEATAQFQELVHAYEVLSDPKERAWYDSHRSQILFSDPTTTSSSSSPASIVPNIFSYFSSNVYSGYGDAGKGFYKVYSDVFNAIYSNEVNYVKKLGLAGSGGVREAPVMGNLESPYEQVTAFYNYWLGFGTVMDFCWVDQYDAMAGINRKSRRVMEDENNKLRKKAKKEFNETVRRLAEFVKKRDKRVIDMMVKREKERERQKEEEKERRIRTKEEKLKKARAYEEPEWARVAAEEEEEEGIYAFEDEEEEAKESNQKEQLYCVVCGKKFKSDKQWKNHEQSKKHKEKVAELRESFVDEDEERDDIEDKDVKETNGGMDGNIEEIEERFRQGFKVREDGNDGVGAVELSDKEDLFVVDAEDVEEVAEEYANGVDDEDEEMSTLDANGNEDEDEDEDISMLKAMALGHKSRRSKGLRNVNEDLPVDVPIRDGTENEEADVMEYNNRKTRRRRAKKDKSKTNVGETTEVHEDERKDPSEEPDEDDYKQTDEFHDVNDGNSIDQSRKSRNSSNQSVGKKGTKKQEANANLKNAKGKKGKGASKNSGNVCETCGEEFESRNRLHKHLGDSGHATLKSR